MPVTSVILPEKSMAILLDAAVKKSGQITGMNLPAILDRIERRALELGMTVNAVGTAVGKPWAVPNIKKAILQGRTSVALSTITELAKPLDVSTNWLLNDDNQPGTDKKISNLSDRRLNLNLVESSPRTGSDDVSSIPEMDARGDIANEKDGSGLNPAWGIPNPFLRDELHISPGKANIVPVRSDSMQTALFVGDRAIINLEDVDVSEGGIFALLDDNAKPIIRQVEVVRGSKGQRILCSARNPVYKPFELDLAGPVRIIGKVVGKISQHL